MSLLTVYIIHEPIAEVILPAGAFVKAIAAVLITILFAADFGVSFKNAYDLRSIIMNNDKIMKELLSVQLHMQSIEAIINDETKTRRDKLLGICELNAERREFYRQNGSYGIGKLIKNMYEYVQSAIDDMEYLNDVRAEKFKAELSAKLAEINVGARRSFEQRKPAMRAGIQSLLRRNPSAVASGYKGAVEELRTHISRLSIPDRIYQKLKKH